MFIALLGFLRILKPVQVVSAGILNLPWMQLRRVTISIYLVFIAVWAGEIPYGDAEQAVVNTLEVLCVIGTRWQSAAQVGQIVVQLADKTGGSCPSNRTVSV